MATRVTSKRGYPQKRRYLPGGGPGRLRLRNVFHDEAESDGRAAVFVEHSELEELKGFESVCGALEDGDGIGGGRGGGCRGIGLRRATGHNHGDAGKGCECRKKRFPT